jgi:hypothetical protein
MLRNFHTSISSASRLGLLLWRIAVQLRDGLAQVLLVEAGEAIVSASAVGPFFLFPGSFDVVMAGRIFSALWWGYGGGIGGSRDVYATPAVASRFRDTCNSHIRFYLNSNGSESLTIQGPRAANVSEDDNEIAKLT